jgi:hypothetical protein
MIATIFGLNPTPSAVYKAIPWTWLVDWFSNIGDVIANLDGGVADRLAADYMYLMNKITFQMARTSYGNYYSGVSWGSSTPFSAECFQGAVSKRRMRASQFGFGVKENELSLTQWSILGALGLSRLS